MLHANDDRLRSLPVDEVLPLLRESLRTARNVVLSAPPGAGKTTRVPVSILDEDWLNGRKIVMLEPRRLAAQRAAKYMALQRAEEVGETVGYRIRGDTRVGKSTRIEVVTEGVLTRMLHADQGLSGIGIVIFDEFHERSIHADLGLALTLDVQANLRDDLRILVMSATLDGVAVSRVLGDVPIVESRGRLFPVETHYRSFPVEGQIERQVAETVVRALSVDHGDLLVFLPGQREIRRVEDLLADAKLPEEVRVHRLFGDAPPDQQQSALIPASPGMRKVILSTSIAETSVTIDGVRVVVDSGLARSQRFDPRRGMSGLVTVPVSRASADQRRGRAGRQQAGVCYRLWTEEQHRALPEFTLPEIAVADLAPPALDLALWGTPDGDGLRFIDPPPRAHLSQAQGLLRTLGALKSDMTLTPHGRKLAGLPMHPRLAHMVIRGHAAGLGSMACDIAVLLDDRGRLRRQTDGDIDLASAWHELFPSRKGGLPEQTRLRAESARLRGLIGAGHEPGDEKKLGVLLGFAYPERIARRRSGETLRYQLANGTGALLPPGSLLSREEFLAVGEVDGQGADVRIFLAAPLERRDLDEWFTQEITTEEKVEWRDSDEAVHARRERRLGALLISEQNLQPEGEAVRKAMVNGIVSMGLDALPWRPDAVAFRHRSEWLRRGGLAGSDWPDLSSEHLISSPDDWLGPHLHGISSRAGLSKLDILAILRARFTYQQLRELDRLAPTHLSVPSGSKIRLDYAAPAGPILAVRLQEMFGLTDTPLVGGGRVKVTIHLLSPAGRPLAVTQDLRSFWMNAYTDVRKEMRGRYPKHHWPEDPLTAVPTRKSKRRSASK